MPRTLRLSLGSHSEPGTKPINQDFHGSHVPSEPVLSLKGAAVVLADGISSSEVSHIASETAVRSFLDDYYCTSDAWSVRTSAERVIQATNAWLYSQTQQSPLRYERDRGYVSTFSALVLKANLAHVLHVGDSRIYRWRAGALEQLTTDHRVRVSAEETYLARALGVSPHVEVDYRGVELERGDVFLLLTDGVYEALADGGLTEFLRAELDGAEGNSDKLEVIAKRLVSAAHSAGSPDNLTAQLVRVDALGSGAATDLVGELLTLPLPPPIQANQRLDGYRIVRELHLSARSHVYLATEEATGERSVLKLPAVDVREDSVYLERFLLEEWVARRIRSPHVLRPVELQQPRSCLYLATEFVDGRTLTQWMLDHPHPELEVVRGLVEQMARGLLAFHKLEMLHQDLRPENVMVDAHGMVKIIDFGSVQVAGLQELAAQTTPAILGTAQYTAPEYFLGEAGTPRSDIFSLGVITYQLLSGRLPYGTTVSQARTRDAQRRLVYQSLLSADRELPAWLDETLRKAVHPDPSKRYAELSEFLYDLRHPSRAFLSRTRPPLIERNPAAFWKGVSGLLAILVVLLLLRLGWQKP